MPRMKLLSSLSFDQIGHAPGRPQPSAIAQRFGTFFQSAAQLLQLRGQQPGFATGPARLEESLGPLFSPGVVPSTDRLTVNPQLPRHLALTVAAIKELGRFEPSPFQVLEIPLNAFWVAHTPKTTTQVPSVSLYYANLNKSCSLPDLPRNWKRMVDRAHRHGDHAWWLNRMTHFHGHTLDCRRE